MPAGNIQKSGVQLIMEGYETYVRNFINLSNQYADNAKKLKQLETVYKTTNNAVARLSKSIVDLAITVDKDKTARSIANAKARSEKYKSEADQVEALMRVQAKEIEMRGRMDIAMANNVEAMNRMQAAQDRIDARMAWRKAAEYNKEQADAKGRLAGSLLPGGGGLGAGIAALVAAQPQLLGVAAAIGAIVVAGRNAGNIVSGAFNAIKGAIGGVASAIGGAARGLVQFFEGIVQFTAGNLLARGIMSAKNSIDDFIGSIGTAVMEFQKVMVMFKGLTARDWTIATGGSMAEGLKATAGQAEILYNWIRKIGVTTPYTPQTLSRMLAMSNAYGLNLDMARKLTAAVIDFGSFMGQDEEVMMRIIYSMGQMVNIGKISGRELRELGNAFVPAQLIMQKMADSAGMTKKQFLALAAAGKVDVMDFIKRFVEMANTDWVGAAERMSNTIYGVINNMRQFRDTIINIDIFGPVLGKATEAANKLIKQLLSPEVQKISKTWGEEILQAYYKLGDAIDKRLVPAIIKLLAAFGINIKNIPQMITDMIPRVTAGLVKIINNVSTFIETTLVQVATFIKKNLPKAIQMGQSFMLEFSKGLVSGLTFVLNAITTIFNTISKLMGGGTGTKEEKTFTLGLPTGEDLSSAENNVNRIEAISKKAAEINSNISRNVKDTGKKVAEEIVEAVNASLTSSEIQQMGADAIAAWLEGAGKEIDTSTLEGLGNRIGQLIGEFSSQWVGGGPGGITASWSSSVQKIFKDAMSSAEEFIRSSPFSNIDKFNVVPTILRAEGAIAQVIDQFRNLGNVSADTINSMLSGIAGLSPQFGEYIASLINLESATKAVADAQERVNAANDAVKIAQDQVSTVTKRYDEDLKSLNSTLTNTRDKYDAILKSLNDQLDAVTNQYDEQKRLADINEALASNLLTSTERERLENEKRAIGIKEQIRTTTEARDKEVGSIEEQIKRVQDQRDAEVEASQARVEAAQAVLEAANKELETRQKEAKVIQEQVDSVKGLIDSQLADNKLIQEQMELLNNLGKQVSDTLKEAQQSEEDFGEGAGDMGSATTGALEEITIDLEKVRAAFNKTFEEAMKAVGTFSDDLKKIFAPLWAEGGPVSKLIEAINNLGEAYKTFITPGGLNDQLKKSFIDTFNGIKSIFDFTFGNANQHFANMIANLEKTIALISGGNGLLNAFSGIGKIVEVAIKAYLLPFKLVLEGIAIVMDGFSRSILEWTEDFSILAETIQSGKWVEAAAKAAQMMGKILIGEYGWGGIARTFGEELKKALDDLSRGILNFAPPAPTNPGYQRGGTVYRGMSSIVGESGPEMFIPGARGTIVPFGQLKAAIMQMVAAPQTYGTVVYDNSVHIEVNPSYKNYQSPAGIYYDISSALAYVGR